MGRLFKIFYIIIFIGAIYTTFEANTMITEFKAYQTVNMNPINKAMNDFNLAISNNNLSINVVEEKIERKSPLLTACTLFMFKNDEYNKIFEAVGVSTLLWIIVAICSIKIFVELIKSRDMNGYLIPLAIFLVILSLYFGLIIGYYAVIMIVALLAGILALKPS